MSENSQKTGKNVGHMIKKLHIHYHGLISADKGSSIAHKTNDKNYFVC